MKKEFGSPITKQRTTFLSQRQWRAAGVVTLAGSAVMAWYGTRSGFAEYGLRVLLIYWGLFALLLLTTLYMALLDIRYTLLQFKLGERELFDKTLGDEAFRRELRGPNRQRDDSGG